jgi:hypothetical protein
MNHCNFEFNFHEYPENAKLVYDADLSSNSSRKEELILFVRAYYRQNMDGWTFEDFQQSNEKYNDMINVAIKSGNVDGLEILWQGIYFHDRANPDFESNVYCAVEFGNLKILQQVLYGYMNYNTLNPIDYLDYNKMVELSKKNPCLRVFEFIKEMSDFVNLDNKIAPMNRTYAYDDESDSDDDEKTLQFKDMSKQFYEFNIKFANSK